MTHGRTNTNKARKKQHGGMKLAREIKKHFISKGIEFSELNVLAFLISKSDPTHVRIVWDASTYSFIFELTLLPGLELLNPFGLSLADSADTHAAFAASTPELGRRVSTFCAKISFACDVDKLTKRYHGVNKGTVSSAKATKEAKTQRMLFEAFACRRTTAPFVPDVLAHAILTGTQFQAMFAQVCSSAVASTTPGVLGTPKEIYDWINAWTAIDGTLRVDVILMEIMDFGRTPPGGVSGTQPFKIIHSLRLRKQHAQYLQAALRMMANIASVRGKGIMPHDFHEGNGMATDDGLQLYLIDWGGLWNLSIPEDLAQVLHYFASMCARAQTTSAQEAAHAMTKLNPAGSTDLEKRVARFPSLEDLCGFFQLDFDDPPDRAKIIRELKQTFEVDLMGFVDFTCVTPTVPDVHHALMMVAFVDFMSNRMIFDDYPYCQCGAVLKVVYPHHVTAVQTTTGVTVDAFDDFRTFLKTYAVASFPSNPNTRLPEVVKLIEENVRLCTSVCSAMQVSELRPSWMNDPARLAAEAKIIRLAEVRLAEARAEAEAKARRAEEEAKARIAKEEANARRAEEEAKARIAEEEARIAKEEARIDKANKMKKLRYEKNLKNREAEIVLHAQAQQDQSVAAAAAVPVPVPRSWLESLNPMSWSWLKKKGGTRKQRKQRKYVTKRRHN